LHKRKEDSSFSEEKEAKRLFSVGGSRSQPGVVAPAAQRFKSLFASFSSEKEDSSFLSQPAPEITPEGLRRGIGFPSGVMLVMGGIVGVGIFVNPAIVARSLPSPEMALLAWSLGGVIAMLGAFVYAELAARLPATGGEYAYLRAVYGPMAGFLFAWTTLLVVHAGGQAAVAIVFASNVNVLLGGAVPDAVLVVGLLGLLAALNCVGLRAGNGVQSSLGALKIIVMLCIIAAGLFFVPSVPAALRAGVVPGGLAGAGRLGAAMIPVVFSFGGWQTANYVAGEMKNPRRDLGRALLAGVAGVIALYLLINMAALHALGAPALGATLTPMSDVLQRAAGPVGAKLAAAAIALSAVAFVSQGMLTGPRVLFALARDGLFFRQVAKVGGTSHAPVGAVLFHATWTAILALTGSFESILSYVIAMNFLFFGLGGVCLFVLRARDTRGARPAFVAPLHPWSTSAFIVACVVIVACSFWAYPVNSLVGYGIMLLGIPPYLLWRRARRREAA
jgi:APA family basic amino acid/polyamine antiporter